MSRLYVYALLDEPLPPARIAGRRVECVPLYGIYAAIEHRSRPPGLSEAGLRLQHRIVVQLARRSDAILPVRFGSWLEPDELSRTVARHRRTLRRALKGVRNREQMTVRIFTPPRRKQRAVAPSSGTAYLRMRRASQTTAAAAALARIQSAVGRMAAAESLDVSSRGFSALHHLIERGREREYRSLVNRAVSDSTDEHHAVVISGPWPPFAFVPDIWP